MATSDVDFANNQEIIQQLVEIYGKNFDLDIIQSVACCCNYDVETTSSILLEMSCETPKKYSDSKQRTPKESTWSYVNAALCSKNRPKQADSKEEAVSANPLNLTTKSQPTSYVHHKSKKEYEFDRLISHVRQGTRILIFMRGLPGSGKSTLAKEIVDEGVGLPYYHKFILSTDDYFYNRRTGQYQYDVGKLPSAHEWNQQRAYKSLSEGISPIIIDNTHTEMWEMRSYAMMAVNFGYYIEIVEPFTRWAFNEKELARRNCHGVPRNKIQRMLEKYDRNVTLKNLFTLYNLDYNSNFKPPLSRNYPPIVRTGRTSKKTDHDNSINFMAEDISNEPESQFERSRSIENFIINSSSNAETLPSNSNVKLSEPEMKKRRTFSLNSDSLLSSTCAISSTNSCDPLELAKEEKSEEISQLNRNRNVYPMLDLASWGLPNNAISSWESWEIVSPLNGPKEPPNPEALESKIRDRWNLQTINSSTNTSNADFSLLNEPTANVKILTACNRNISEGVAVVTSFSPPKKTVLHKSSMTDDDLSSDLIPKVNAASANKIDELISLFPNIPKDYLSDVYEKCKGNLEWAVDLLLDDQREIVESLQNVTITSTKTEMPIENNLEEPSRTVNRISPKFKTPSPDVDELKKHIEENVEINKNYYSYNVLKIKNRRRGICYEEPDLNEPSTSSGFSLQPREFIENYDSGSETDSIEEEEEEEEETVELNLGGPIVSVLENMFGFPEAFPRGLLPVVKVPSWMAKQLHALYLESLSQQMVAHNSVLNMITKQDEEFAKKLQKQEEAELLEKGGKTPELRLIMDEQMAQNIVKKDNEEWKKLTPDTLAAKLTRQKLFSSFPTVDQVTLLEILHAYDNSYEQTVEVLLASTEKDKIYDPDGNVREPPITDVVVNEMKIAQEQMKQSVDSPDISKSPNEYREEAKKHLETHDQLIQKAQQAYQKKQYAVAQFYSEIAKTHTQFFDQANNLAASAFLQQHSQRLQNFHTLDLHYLYVKEALAALDMFLDKNVRLLQGSKKQSENLFVITGRGKRSGQGKARIKPAVIARLRKRNIWYCELNPGLFKIRIRQHSVVTNDIRLD